MPWDKQAVLDSVRKTSKVLVLHEDTRTGGFGGEIAATIAEEAFEDLDAPVRRMTAPDTPVPFSPVLEKAFIPQVDGVANALKELIELLMASTTAVDVVMPQMGVSVSEGTITKWSKSVGDTIEADETLLEISTDKVDTEVPSPASGVVTEILVQEGETVEVGTVLARIGGEPAQPLPHPRPRARAGDAARSRSVSRSGDRGPGSAGRAASAAGQLRPLRDRRSRLRRETERRSSRRWSRASPPSTASTRRRYPVPAPAAASRRRTSRRSSKRRRRLPQAPAAQAAPQPAAAPAPAPASAPAAPPARGRATRKRTGSGDRRLRAGGETLEPMSRDAAGDRRAHAPLARHVRARHVARSRST